jgi:hypothetical protein
VYLAAAATRHAAEHGIIRIRRCRDERRGARLTPKEGGLEMALDVAKTG